MKRWSFKPLDSSFFRGANPFNMGEGGFLDSQFPPTAQTLAGVMRSAIAEAKGVNWQAFRNNQQPEIAQLIGRDSDDPGQLSFVGPYLIKDGERLYPLPLCLLRSEAEQAWMWLTPSPTVLKTDMGEKHLPLPQEPLVGAKPLEGAWLDGFNMQAVLNGKVPATYINAEMLFLSEARVGIERDNRKRQANDGMLYFTRHVRLQEGVGFGMAVHGADDVEPAAMVRLGGEGRMAQLTITDAPACAVTAGEGGNRYMLMLLTHGDFGGKSEPNLPQGVQLVAACVGKAVREGGWDYKKHRPKSLKSLVPAGSCYFVEGDEATIRALHGKYIGNRTAFGYGELAVGICKEGK